MNRGEIVLIRYPFSDFSGSKVRPAVVISSDKYNSKSADVLFMLISSKTDNQQITDLLIEKNDSEFIITGLKKSSLVRTDKIVYLAKSLAKRKLGKVGTETQKKINIKLLDVFGLS